MSKLVIYCDFDGTITNQDNIISIMKKFAPPAYLPIKENILGQKQSIREGVAQMFSLLPVSIKDQIISYLLDQAEIREGFADFVSYTRKHDIPLYIVSGGIDFFVHPMLEKFGPFSGVYCNEADFSGERIQINFPHVCDDLCTSKGCGCCKPSIIRKLQEKDSLSVVIGDSITDLEAAKLADVVIARDFLIEKCKELNIPYEPFENFRDVMTIIETRLGVQT
ncbi:MULTISPECIES: 2-hydroxy-3-keto-5-methylthiopentenyl-1-phosphate phosphatase [Bacillaceae]|uniref:2-hydroxy-3-keto-5-methylthiopentenyl-1- phosphate phosphatase n=1 Tax=Bacillaceae TaxID=186817 RepID=UPI0007022770|nr:MULTISPECIES: 2-hydroxy-3-keto-5-methylthiopentenyl-1-phosphate phosphatase [Bacillaceae]KQL34672.1 2-hydroxy-3-keto-5-methylthiopentenyl-1-phosphate phosphatase [Psychrobacillus sp. FJAT-21963]MDF2067427.1 2-hydroxy-3-keto-5-methylthiopentenyl-1-phosphate phosphatase [Bacillus sp. Cr_A10]